jgi:hypothetical protein
MVWGGVCSTARTCLHVFPRVSTNSTVYVTDILDQYVIHLPHLSGIISSSSMIMQDRTVL